MIKENILSVTNPLTVDKLFGITAISLPLYPHTAAAQTENS